jgi:signal-transduction protein with cAMP-binding, CBS, and nucleotidyltransferase domain
VVDSAGQLVGMVSLVDLVGRVGETVADVMTSDPVSAGQDASVDDVAGMMLDQMVRRVPIVEGGRVIGIVSASDIIRVFLNLHDSATERSAAERSAAERPAAARQAPAREKTRRPGARRPAAAKRVRKGTPR